MHIEPIAKERNIYSVTEITRKIQLILEENFSDIWVRGEISNFRIAASGHMYFTLKDTSAVIKAVLFKGYQKNVRFELNDGLTVIAHGNIDVFDKRGDYQIIIDLLEPEGVGALQLAFEQLKEKLMKEGLFDEAHKKDIPTFPHTIGIITSPTGAALRDILNVVGRRYKGMNIIIYPVLVQGEGAANEIVTAIKTANARNEVDVLIIGRGGGSIEDLWPFNEEIVVRAIYDSDIPIISAVGHEIDFTISDFAADLRAPTPSAAAELVVKNKEELIKWSQELLLRLFNSFERILVQKNEKLSFFSIELLQKKIQLLLNQKNMILDDSTRHLTSSVDGVLAKFIGRFEKVIGQLNALSPLDTLSRGFAFITKLPENIPVFSINVINKGDEIKTRLKDGSVLSRVHQINKKL
jgi:exodeoxyribonuclease VII large subunit